MERLHENYKLVYQFLLFQFYVYKYITRLNLTTYLKLISNDNYKI